MDFQVMVVAGLKGGRRIYPASTTEIAAKILIRRPIVFFGLRL